jgi:LmbE family N-acetylglucosaminyl deacetylase
MGPAASIACAPGGRTERNPLLNPRRGDVIAFLLAHPDDESIFTGGTMARLAEARAVTVLITATLGELGRPNDPVVRAALGDGGRIATVRKDELRRACATLGVSHQTFLGGEGRFGDSGYQSHAWSNDCLARNSDTAALELVALLRRVRPHLLVTFDRDGCTGHPDHLACHRIALRAAEILSAYDDCLHGLALIADTLPSRRRSHPSAAGESVAIDIATVRKRKATAVSCHFSQVGGAVQDQTQLAFFRPGSAIAQYLPHVISDRPAARHELYAWVSAAQLAATDGA